MEQFKQLEELYQTLKEYQNTLKDSQSIILISEIIIMVVNEQIEALKDNEINLVPILWACLNFNTQLNK